MYLYRKALAADDAFETAIKKQFGESATRWDHDRKLYNENTRKYARLKHSADAEWIAEMRKNRS